MYRYKSLGLCAGDVDMAGACDCAPKFGIVLAKVIDDARRLLKTGDFERLKSWRLK